VREVMFFCISESESESIGYIEHFSVSWNYFSMLEKPDNGLVRYLLFMHTSTLTSRSFLCGGADGKRDLL
jgi:hypothetical protein